MATSKTATPTKTAAKAAGSKTSAAKTDGAGSAPAKPPVVATATPMPAPSRIPAPGIKPAPVTVPPVSVVMGGANPDAEEAFVLKKKVLIERVVAASGAKKKDVKPIVEAALRVLGDALSKGEELNLPPLGKMKINRHREDGAEEMLVLKLRRSDKFGSNGSAGKDALEDDGEDD